MHDAQYAEQLRLVRQQLPGSGNVRERQLQVPLWRSRLRRTLHDADDDAELRQVRKQLPYRRHLRERRVRVRVRRGELRRHVLLPE